MQFYQAEQMAANIWLHILLVVLILGYILCIYYYLSPIVYELSSLRTMFYYISFYTMK